MLQQSSLLSSEPPKPPPLTQPSSTSLVASVLISIAGALAVEMKDNSLVFLGLVIGSCFAIWLADYLHRYLTYRLEYKAWKEKTTPKGGRRTRRKK